MRFKSYDQFLNEGLFDKAKELLKKVGDWFRGIGSFFLNVLLLQKEKKLPKGVTIYPTRSDVKLLKDNGVDISIPKIPALKESWIPREFDQLVYEKTIETRYPDLGKVRDVNFDELQEAIRDSVEGGVDVKPLLVWGAPGIGKTAIINAVAKEYFGANAKEEKRMIDFDLMTMSPEDFFLPSIQGKDTDDPKVVRAPDSVLPVRRIDDKKAEDVINGPDGKGGILFFDEVARCSPKMQQVCLKLIDERKIGNYVLGEKWVIICAANRKSDLSDDEQELFNWSSTLANRFRQINYAASVEDWAPWAMSAKDNLGDLIVKPEIVAFLKFNQKYFHMLDPEEFSSSSGGSEAWPSPRTWTNASQAIKVRHKRLERNKWKDDKGRPVSNEKWMQIQKDILSDNVGKDAAEAFTGFQKLMTKINPEDVKLVFTDAKKAPKWEKLSLDEKYALIASAVFQKRDAKGLTKDEMKNFGDWLILNKDAPNAVKALRLMVEVVPSVEEDDNWNDIVWTKMVDAYPGTFQKEKK
jgi:DNA polymerase III delta prime subunit